MSQVAVAAAVLPMLNTVAAVVGQVGCFTARLRPFSKAVRRGLWSLAQAVEVEPVEREQAAEPDQALLHWPCLLRAVDAEGAETVPRSLVRTEEAAAEQEDSQDKRQAPEQRVRATTAARPTILPARILRRIVAVAVAAREALESPETRRAETEAMASRIGESNTQAAVEEEAAPLLREARADPASVAQAGTRQAAQAETRLPIAEAVAVARASEVPATRLAETVLPESF